MANRSKIKRWLAIAAVVFLSGSIVLNLLAYRHAHAMLHFVNAGKRTSKPEKLSAIEKFEVLLSGVTLPRPNTTDLPTSLHPECRNISIKGTNNVTLGAWYSPHTPESPLVILFHGYGGEKSGTIREAKAFFEMGLSVFLVDFRGSGESSESYTTIGFDEGAFPKSKVISLRPIDGRGCGFPRRPQLRRFARWNH